MTENKRYSMKGSTILENGEEITAWDCCDLLNELNDENEQLKKELKSFKPIIFESDGKSVTLYEKRGDVE